MPKCLECGASVKEGQKFCNKCGAKLYIISEKLPAKFKNTYTGEKGINKTFKMEKSKLEW